MSQNIYLSSDETGLWSGGGNIYRSLKQARRHVEHEWVKGEDGYYVRDERGHYVRGKQRPIYRLDITWTLVGDEDGE